MNDGSWAWRRRDVLSALGLGGLTLLVRSCLPSPGKKRRPNFLFILVDDLGWADLGCYGSRFYETPHLDGLAASGMRFTDAYASCPVCSPTRASIMTGRYPARLGITDWIPGNDPKDRKLLGPEDEHALRLEEATIAEILRDSGYRTFFAGKWHLGGPGYYPEDQGFQVNIGGFERGSPPGGYYVPYQNPKLPDGPEGEYLTNRLTDETLRFIGEERNRPFFAFLSFYTVHTPIQANRKHIGRFQAKADALPKADIPYQIPEHDGFTKIRQDNPDYASMVAAMDENVGRLLEGLRERGLDRDTVVLFTSDNGGLSTLRRRGYPTSNLPLRAGKGWCYEGGIRVPLIVVAPGITKAGSVSSEPVLSTDFLPTISDLADVTPETDLSPDGRSLLPVFNGEPLQRQALFWHYPHYHGSAWTPGAAVRAGDWKLIEFYDKEKTELYNLRRDPGERTDLASTEPVRKNELLDLLRTWQEEVGAKMPRPNPRRKS